MITKVGIYKDPRNKIKPWVVRWYTTADPETGKPKRLSRAFEFLRDAEKFKTETAGEFEQRGRPSVNPEKQQLDSFLNIWLKRRSMDLQPGSIYLYKLTCKRLRDFFGRDGFLNDVTMEKAEDFILAQKNHAFGKEGDNLSDWSREQIKNHCKTMFKDAVRWKYIRENPFSAMRAKKLTSRRWYRMKAQEYFDLIDATPNMRTKVAYSLFYTAGLRLHEAFNLTWNEIDFHKNLLMVVNREPTKDIPPFHIKDHESRRIPLPQHTIDLLTQWQAEAPEGVPFILLTRQRYDKVKEKWQNFQKSGKAWQGKFVINNVLRNFNGHVKRAGIKPVGKFTIHTLRKNAGQNWADNLPMAVTKELMGHSSIETTAEYYNQVDRDHELKAADVIQQLLENGKAENKKTDVNLTYEADLAGVRENQH